MPKVISTSERVYNQFKEWAEKDHRSISKELEFLVDSILNRKLVFVDHIAGQRPVIQPQPSQQPVAQQQLAQPVQLTQESYEWWNENFPELLHDTPEAQKTLDELDRLYEEAMKKPKPVLNRGFLTPEEIEKYSGQNIIVNDD